MKTIAVVAGMLLALSAAGAQAPKEGRIANWDRLRDTVVVSLESPAKEQQMSGAWVQPVGGSRIPMRNFVIQIDLFTDFVACPACRNVESALQTVLLRYPVHMRYLIHLPSSNRPQSMEAAKVFDCAYEDGQGREMFDVLRKRHADLGGFTWDSLAREAMIYDTVAFRHCVGGPPSARIQAGMALAKQLGLRAAPAVVVDGWLVSPLTEEALRKAIDEAAVKRRTGR